MTLVELEHYTYRVRWSAEDDAHIGTVAELPSLSWVADSQDEAFAGIRELVKTVLEDMADSGEEPPRPLADRSYSGKFMVRVTPETHRRLAVAAAEPTVSHTRWAARLLADPDLDR
ncbi:MAG: toxin-antitoxin system HicB family antitoxin [Propionibacteriaceae bacterium]|jgi:predicted HicB family RNase H-like nuclease|nr:toxin-antitoxin system HicB family antitoxin [Propionibacteriaceae bacterium]